MSAAVACRPKLRAGPPGLTNGRRPPPEMRGRRPRRPLNGGRPTISEQEEVVPDILQKFIQVAGPVSEVRTRETIRKSLALEKEDLQICFVNEIASDEEILEDSDVAITKAGMEIANRNISQKLGQIIVPIYTNNEQSDNHNGLNSLQTGDTSSSDDDDDDEDVDEKSGHSRSLSSSAAAEEEALPVPELGGAASPVREFSERVARLQEEARQGLILAKAEAAREIERGREEADRTTSCDLFALVGIRGGGSRLNRRTLSSLTVGQLQVILNDFLAQIEKLNEELVEELLSRDERNTEQDALLTDIQDLSEFINF